MQLQYKKWLAACSFGALGLIGAGSAQAQAVVQPYINVTVGAPLSNGVYGRIQIGAGAPVPPLYSSRPVVALGRPGMHADPMYLYVPSAHRQNWARYCHRYNACQHPVYFVNGPAAIRRHPATAMPEKRRRPAEPVAVRQHRSPQHAPHAPHTPYAAASKRPDRFQRHREEQPPRRQPEQRRHDR